MGLTINCNSCKASITKKDTVVRCVSCEKIMHMTTQCTQLSGTVINAPQEINLNVLLLCNNCVKTIKQDVVLDAISSQNKIVQSNENQEEMKIFVKETIGNQLKNEITSFKSAVEGNLNDLGDIATKKVKPKTEPPTNDHPSGVRVRGIPELKDTNARKRAQHDKAEIENILKFLNVDSNIEDCRRIGTYNENKDRTIMVKLSNDWNGKLLVLSLGKLRNYDKKVYLSRNYQKKNNCLKRIYLKKDEKLSNREYQETRSRSKTWNYSTTMIKATPGMRPPWLRDGDQAPTKTEPNELLYSFSTYTASSTCKDVSLLQMQF